MKSRNVVRPVSKIYFNSWTANQSHTSFFKNNQIMACLPRPKIFRRRRDRSERPNALARFASTVSTFFSSLFVYTVSSTTTTSGTTTSSSTTTTSAISPQKKRENILKRMRQARSNRVGIMPTISKRKLHLFLQ